MAKAHAEAEDLKVSAKSGTNVAKGKEKHPLIQTARTFEGVATTWLNKKTPEWDDAHAKRQKERLVGNIFPVFGDVDINTVTMEHIDNALTIVIKRGARETA